VFSLIFIRRIGYAKFLTRLVRWQFTKRILKRGIDMTLPTGLSLHAPAWSVNGSEIYYTGADVDWGAEALLARLQDRGKIFLDVGAHIGYFSLYMAPLAAHVYGFEPDLRAAGAFSHNQLQSDNITLVPNAVAAEGGTYAVTPGHYSGATYLDGAEDGAGQAGLSIIAVTIDGWATDHADETVGAIKIDTDGTDLEIAKSARQIIRRDQPLILMEFLAGGGNEASALFAFAEEIEYRIYGYCGIDDPGGPRFERVTADSFAAQTLKMLFLTPPDLWPEMESLSQI
jgi:FkbM family methyltransferase